MTELNDHELLAEFARTESEPAFAELVARYVNLAYSTALRFTGNPHHAEEITQAVFIILAHKMGKLSSRVVLSGWLYQTTRLTAANFMKGEIRRQNREQEAYMQSTLNESSAMDWQQIAPHLDDAMGRLGETDRTAVVLRFFENKTAAEIAAALNTTEAAAHKRVNRALEKLRKIFSKRGVTLSAALIAGAVSANSVHAAPMGLATVISATATQGAAISTTITALVKGTMKTMTWIKMKFAACMAITALLAGGAATVAVSQTHEHETESNAREIAQQSLHAYAELSSYQDSGKVISHVGNFSIPTTFKITLQRPNMYRVKWTQTTKYFTNGGVVWSDGHGNFMEMKNGGYTARPERFNSMQSALASATGVSGMATATIPGTFFQQNWGDALRFPASGRSEVKLEKDGKIGDVDCYVISSVIDTAKMRATGKLPSNMGKFGTGTSTTKFWIGKQDHLIHQVQTIVDTSSIVPRRLSDADIKNILEKQNKPATPQAIAEMRNMVETAMKQAHLMAKSGKISLTQTHDHIVVNRKFSPSDFAP